MDVFANVAAGMLSNAHTARSGLLQCNKCHVGGRVVVTFGRNVWPSSQGPAVMQDKMCIVYVQLMQVLGGWQACFKILCLFAFLQHLDLLSLPAEQSLSQHLPLLACHTDQPSTTHQYNTHFLSCMGFYLRLLDPEKGLQTLQTLGAPCLATWRHIPQNN